MSRQELAKEWKERLEDFSLSEMTVQQWCDFNGVFACQYYYWKRRLAHTQQDKTEKPHFLALGVVSAPPPKAPGGVTIRIAGAAIEVEAHFDPHTLRAVVEALGAHAC